VLSVKDTGELIKASKQGKDDEEFYNNFRERQFNALDRLAEYLISSEESPADMAMELAVQSYLYKVACEYLIDQIVEEFWRSSEKTEDGKRDKESGATNKGGKK